MNKKIVFPEGKTKALVLSYDDNQIADRRLVELFNKYGLKGTFHVNHGTLGGDVFLSSDEIVKLYEGHELSGHGVEHLFPNQLSKEELVREVWDNRLALEKISGKIVKGFSYAYGEYSASVKQTLSDLGVVYSRTVNAIYGLNTPADFLEWHPSCHHAELFGDREKTQWFLDTFLDTPDYIHLPLLFIWGHSFEFDRNDQWEDMEELCKLLAGRDDVWYTTAIDYYHYIQAIRGLESSADGSIYSNPSATKVWYKEDGKLCQI